MNFCGNYGYDYGFDGSDTEEIEDNEILDNTKSRKKKIRRADCNVISIKFDHLTLSNETFPGEPIKCVKCEAVMTSASLKSYQVDSKVWTCEFCDEANDLTQRIQSLDEISKNETVTYLLEPASATTQPTNAATSEPQGSQDDSYLTFCIDISGSMDTRIEVKNNNGELTGTNTTRLQGVQCACLKNLELLKSRMPARKVNLITFSNSIKYYADGRSREPVLTLNGSSQLFHSLTQTSTDSDSFMFNREKMLQVAANQDANLKKISESFNNISGHIKNLRTEGATALGPALVFSIGFCSKKPGSQVILCTDGCANAGMGNLDSHENSNSEKFYEDLADYAKEKGVSVNVISMEGTDCRLALLGKVADKTNGTIDIVNPLDLGDLLASILDKQIVATSVRARLIVNHRYLYIRDEELEQEENKAIEADNEEAKQALNSTRKSIVVKEIGNASTETEITFEYGVRKLKGKTNEAFKELPFQLQIYYTALDGSKALKVITKTQKFTKNRAEAERHIKNTNILWTNADQKISSYVLSANVSGAKYKQMQQMNYVNSNKLDAPHRLVKTSHLLSQIKKTTDVSTLDDEFSKHLYQGKKVSSKAYHEDELKLKLAETKKDIVESSSSEEEKK